MRKNDCVRGVFLGIWWIWTRHGTAFACRNFRLQFGWGYGFGLRGWESVAHEFQDDRYWNIFREETVVVSGLILDKKVNGRLTRPASVGDFPGKCACKKKRVFGLYGAADVAGRFLGFLFRFVMIFKMQSTESLNFLIYGRKFSASRKFYLKSWFHTKKHALYYL